jgi:TrmH family RNA methyltransferase
VQRRSFITSTSNQRLKALRRLRRRRASGLVVVDGHRQLRAALAGGAAVREVYAAPELFLGELDERLVAAAARRGAVVVELGAAAFASVSDGVRPDGLLAVVERPATDLVRLRPGPAPLLLVAEAIERPGNLGTVIRSAVASGATALLACAGRTDPFHPETVRGSVGTVFRLPVVETTTEVALAWLRERRVRVVVASPAGTRPYWEADLTGAVAVVVGNERHGVTSEWPAAADETVQIPMPGPADSLNVAVAAGVVLFEAARQRQARTKSNRPSRRRPSRRTATSSSASKSASVRFLGSPGK